MIFFQEGAKRDQQKMRTSKLLYLDDTYILGLLNELLIQLLKRLSLYKNIQESI